jgi:hypothetical protein
MALVSSVPIQKAEPKRKLQAPGSPARCCGKEVPNGIRRVGDSRALRRGLSYLAYQFQSRREEERPDVVQYEVEPAFSIYPATKSSRSHSRTRHQSIPGGDAERCRGCKFARNYMKQDRAIKPGEERGNTTARARVERLAGPERRARAASQICGNAKGETFWCFAKSEPATADE